MTPRQHDLLVFVIGFIDTNRFSPSFVEMSAGIGLGGQSKSSIARLIASLKRQGLVTQPYSRARELQVTPAGRAAVGSRLDLGSIDSVALAAELCRRGHGVELRPAPVVLP